MANTNRKQMRMEIRADWVRDFGLRLGEQYNGNAIAIAIAIAVFCISEAVLQYCMFGVSLGRTIQNVVVTFNFRQRVCWLFERGYAGGGFRGGGIV